tara:strand:+ start:28 stop:513 length:486 start_codon:yes stop_codon:yes gene_type:complete
MLHYKGKLGGHMKLTEQQIENIISLDISGKGGKDRELAGALGFTRKSEKYFDALSPCGKKWEFKKQQSQQFLDPYKFSKMTKQEKKDIGILFFIHKKGKVVEIYETNYKNLIKSMGYSHWDLKAIQKLYKRNCFVNRSNTQIKAELKYSEISKFKLIWKKT